jgi:GTPase Era involved in 16S rRNA processing
MIGADSSKEVDALRSRMGVLNDVVGIAEGRIDDGVFERAKKLCALSSERLGHGTSHTVVALAGATGSGKSSLFNAVSGTEFAVVGVRRPTTSQAFAVVFGDGANELLDWLLVPQRERISAPDDQTLAGLVLLDLPDHDSTEATNRAEVERLVEVVDVFVWVVDPQKYADASLHDDFLQRFAGHAAVTIVVLNQIDRLSPAERTACLDDLTRLLVADGLQGVRVMGVSASTGEGIDALRRELGARVAERRALVRRLDADFDCI